MSCLLAFLTEAVEDTYTTIRGGQWRKMGNWNPHELYNARGMDSMDNRRTNERPPWVLCVRVLLGDPRGCPPPYPQKKHAGAERRLDAGVQLNTIKAQNYFMRNP